MKKFLIIAVLCLFSTFGFSASTEFTKPIDKTEKSIFVKQPIVEIIFVAAEIPKTTSEFVYSDVFKSKFQETKHYVLKDNVFNNFLSCSDLLEKNILHNYTYRSWPKQNSSNLNIKPFIWCENDIKLRQYSFIFYENIYDLNLKNILPKNLK